MPLPDPDRSGSHRHDDAARLLPLSSFFAYQVISRRFSFFFFCDPSDENWVLSLNDVLQIATLM